MQEGTHTVTHTATTAANTSTANGSSVWPPKVLRIFE
jgi:hypothetical protein